MIVFLVNHVSELRPHQTTTRLIEACSRAGRRVAVTDVLSLAVHNPTDVRAHGVVIEPDPARTRDEICAAARASHRDLVHLTRTADVGGDCVMLRTSPGRDLERAWAHRLALQAARLVRDAGVAVVNDPVGLERASSKLYGACLPPELTCATLVAHGWPAVRDFIRALGRPAVIKPLLGSQGRNVFFVDDADEPNLSQLCALLGETGYLVVQEFLPQAAEGDVRVLLLDGRILEVDGAAAAVRRVPRAGEFRSNVALGAQAQATTLTAEQRRVAERAAARVAEDGIRFSGLDLVGNRIVEVNVYSTGGLVDAELFYERDFASVVMNALAGV